MSSTISSVPAWTVTPQAGNQINSTAISADGSRMILGTSNEYSTGQFAVFCYDATGSLLWQHPITFSAQPIDQGVFWVAISRDGKYAAAGGEISKQGQGFLFAYAVDSGEVVLDFNTTARVNQVSLSEHGEGLLAAYGNEAQLFKLQDRHYVSADTYTVNDQAYINSAMLSNKGNRAVLSAIQYQDQGDSDSESFGSVIALNVENDKFSLQSKTDLDTGPIRVSIIDSGQWWGASLHDGSCVVMNDFSDTLPVWRYVPEERTDIAYAFSILASDSDGLYVSYGANIEDSKYKGCVYALKSDVVYGAFKPELLWKGMTEFGVNPGVNMDLNAQYVTATDGSPYGHDETAGNFYLFDQKTGQQLWNFPTSMMNWPMSIAADGNAIFGASDNGNAYYWRATSD